MARLSELDRFKVTYTIGSRDCSQDQELQYISAELNKLGLLKWVEEDGVLTSAGNFSVRHSEGYLMTGRGVDKSTLGYNDLVLLTVEGDRLFVQGEAEPSRETLMHLAVYQKFSGVRAVIHVHDDSILKHGAALRIPETRRHMTSVSYSEAGEIADLLANHNCVNIKNHGQVIHGRSVSDAVNTLYTLHEQALKLF